jgi:hypothetical protein
MGWGPLLGTCAACWLVFAVAAWRWALEPSERERWGRLLGSLTGRGAVPAAAGRVAP